MRETLENARENIRNFIEENSRLTVAVTGILIALILGAIVAIGFVSVPSRQGEVARPETMPYSATGEFFPPRRRPLTEDYYFMRQQKSQWTDEEFSRWFTVPTEETVEELGKSNQKTADDIIGAAP